ncbi:DUF664 domain-containing protein [Klenkia terrae]|uniref:mycothiol transferase n=1 Tax=Klenkia terrae TaxID=1052259 RepID=UPI003606F774
MDEHELWLRSIADQRAAFRAAVSGLTEEQARAVPSASALSLAVLVKHAVWGRTPGWARGWAGSSPTRARPGGWRASS